MAQLDLQVDPAGRSIPVATPGAGAGPVLAWAGLALHLASRAYRAFLLTLVLIALAPVALGWTTYVVRSGSMEPGISVGDTVLAQDFGADEEVPLGRVVIFPNQSRPSSGQLVVHRVVSDLGGGEFATAGDANPAVDAEPITATDVRARARLLVPLVGHVLVWHEEGRIVPLAL